jgi:hypothetical protein
VVSAGLVPMSDMPSTAVAAVVSAQAGGMRSDGYEIAQVGGGITLALVYPLAGAGSQLGAYRGHNNLHCSACRLGSKIPADHPHRVSLTTDWDKVHRTGQSFKHN